MKRTPRAPRSGPSPRPPAARALPAAPAPSPPRRVRAPRAAPAASPARRRPRRRRGAARPRGDPRRSPSSSRCPFASSAAPGTCAEISEMTRGQVASVSIGSGFRNAPGMPEPNIFNSVATSGSAGPARPKSQPIAPGHLHGPIKLGVSRAPRRVRLAPEGMWARLGGGGRAA